MRGIRSRATLHASATSGEHGKTPICCSAKAIFRKCICSLSDFSRSRASLNALARRRWLSLRSSYDTVTSFCITQACTVRRKKSRFGRLWLAFAAYCVLRRLAFFVRHSTSLTAHDKATVTCAISVENVVLEKCCIFATACTLKPSFERGDWFVIWRVALTLRVLRPTAVRAVKAELLTVKHRRGP